MKNLLKRAENASGVALEPGQETPLAITHGDGNTKGLVFKIKNFIENNYLIQ